LKESADYEAKNKKEIVEIGKKCIAEQLINPVQCYNAFGATPAAKPEEKADPTEGIAGLNEAVNKIGRY